MADVWGGSWGTSWGSSWGEASAPTPLPTILGTRETRLPMLSLWDKHPLAGGTPIRPHLGGILQGSTHQRSVSGEDLLSLRVDDSAEWLDVVGRRQLIRVEDEVIQAVLSVNYTPPKYLWYRINRINRSDGLASGTATVQAVPLLLDLRECGPVFDASSGERTYDLGEIRVTREQHWDTFIAPSLTAYGLGHWGEDFADGTEVTVAVNDLTPLDYIARLLSVQGGGPVANDNGTTLVVEDVLAAGIDTATKRKRIEVSDIVPSIHLELASADLFTVVIPTRGTPTDATHPDGIGQVVFEVEDVSGSIIGVKAPEGLAGEYPMIPIEHMLGGETGVDNHYLAKADGTLTEITDTDPNGNGGGFADAEIIVGDATGITVGDLVEIRRDSAGTLVSEVLNPPLLAGQKMGRKTARTTSQDTGGRNYATNGLFRLWGDPAPVSWPTVYSCRTSASYTAGTTSVDLKELPVSTQIPDNSVVVFNGNDSVVTTVNGNQNTDGSGNITLSLDGAVSDSAGMNANVAGFIVLEPSAHFANQWSPVGGSPTAEDPTGQMTPLWLKRDLEEATGPVSCQLATAINFGGTTSPWIMDLEGLPANHVLQPGDLLVRDANPAAAALVIERVQADGSGDVSVRVWAVPVGAWSLADDVTIQRPDFASLAAGTRGLLTFNQGVESLDELGFITDAVTVRHQPGWILRGLARWAVYNNEDTDVTWTPSGTVAGLKLALVDGTAGVGSELVSVADAERTFPSREITVVEMTADHVPTSTESYRLRLDVLRATDRDFDGSLTIMPLEVSLSYTPQGYDMTGIEFSGANQAWRKAAEFLTEHDEGRQITVRMTDRAYDGRYDAAARKLVLAGLVNIHSPKFGFSPEVVTITRMRHDITDPKNTLELGVATERVRLTGVL